MLGMLTPPSFVLLFGRLPAHKVRPPTPTLLLSPYKRTLRLSTLTLQSRFSLCFRLRPFLLSRLKMKLFSSATLLLLLVLTSSYLHGSMAADSAFCKSKCKVRCGKAGVMDRCLYYCGMCCEECKCVPSGTYGNKDECPCYRDKVTKDDKKKSKCP
ncbi:unnamed protein product [Musa textilis]